jgi:hypothetical protein
VLTLFYKGHHIRDHVLGNEGVDNSFEDGRDIKFLGAVFEIQEQSFQRRIVYFLDGVSV